MEVDRPIRVAVFRPHNFDSIHIVVFKDWGEKIEVLNPVAMKKGEVKWVWVEYDTIGVPEPTFMLPRVLDRLGVQGIAQQLVNGFAELGIVPETVEELESVAAARQAHLEDMRRLIFDMDWMNIQKGVPVELEREEPSADLRFQMPEETHDREVSETE